MALSPAGFLMMLMMPIAGRLVGKMDARLLVALGYAVTAIGLHIEGLADPLSWAEELHGLPDDELRMVMGGNMMQLLDIST